MADLINIVVKQISRYLCQYQPAGAGLRVDYRMRTRSAERTYLVVWAKRDVAFFGYRVHHDRRWTVRHDGFSAQLYGRQTVGSLKRD